MPHPPPNPAKEYEPNNGPIRTWPQVLQELQRRHGWVMTRQNAERIAGIAMKKMAVAWQAGKPSAWMQRNGVVGGKDAAETGAKKIERLAPASGRQNHGR